jgi:geranylgeranyl diphosphate synthase type 3
VFISTPPPNPHGHGSIDDIEDDSMLRRGIPVAHKIYGIPSTINCANYVYFLALQKLSTFPPEVYPAAVDIFTTELLSLHQGQGLELYWRDSSQCPSLQAYEAMVRDKTGGLLRLSVRLMQLLASSPRDYVPLVDILGIHFQIRDDYMNLFSLRYEENKGFAEDITEGKFSFPMIHYIHAHPESRQLQSRWGGDDVAVSPCFLGGWSLHP